MGEINLSGIELKTVPNPYFNKLSNERRLNDFFIEGNESLIVTENNIIVVNSIFENDTNFSKVLFNAPADFSRTKFNASANFSQVIFKDSANFSQTTFNAPVSFSLSCFYNSTYFSETKFNNSADFSQITFNNSVDFYEANFNDSVYFIFTQLNGPVDFTWVTFNGYADFSAAYFNATVCFRQTSFENSAIFWVTEFNAPAYFIWATFNDSAYFDGPYTSENIITAGEACETFMNYFKSEAQYVDADNIYYAYRKNAQERESLMSLPKWIDIICWITCGYGVRPFRILYSGVFIVGVFTLLYWQGKGIYRSSDIGENKSEVSFWDALYFSTSTFTTLGSADWYPTDSFRKWVTLEGLLGWIMLGIFMATLTTVMIRV